MKLKKSECKKIKQGGVVLISFIIIIFAVLMFIRLENAGVFTIKSTSLPEVSPYPCHDSDGGIDLQYQINIKGRTTGVSARTQQSISATDECTSDPWWYLSFLTPYVKEYYCGDDGYIYGKAIRCPTSFCEDGRCIDGVRPTTTTTVRITTTTRRITTTTRRITTTTTIPCWNVICGDGICNVNCENYQICPADCGRDLRDIPWTEIILVIVVLTLFIGLIYFLKKRKK